MAIGWSPAEIGQVLTTAFGETRAATPHARVQIDAVYGLLSSDVSTATSGSGATAGTGSLFTCDTGAVAGASAEIRSARHVRYRPGEGVLVRCTARFTPGVADSQQLAGAFNACDGMGFGYLGTTFGVFRRIAGAIAIQQLTVTAGASGIETLTVTLDGEAFVLPPTSEALSAQDTATFIAAQANSYAGWSRVHAQAVGSTVQFYQDTPSTATGAFTLTSSGTATGTFATVQSGEPNTLDVASGSFIPQTAWNVDRLDGSNGPRNPSGLVLAAEQLNVYEVVLPFLGAGALEYRVMTPQRVVLPVHRIEYPGSSSVPNMRNPSLWLGWQARSLGSTTPLVVQGASAAGFVEGVVLDLRNPFAASTTVTATTTEQVALAIRVRGEFGGTVNLREVFPRVLTASNDTNNRTLLIRGRVNPTLSGAFVWAQHDAGISAVDTVLAPANVTATDGQLIDALALAGAQSGSVQFGKSARLGPGDVLAVTVQVSSITAGMSLALSWTEV